MYDTEEKTCQILMDGQEIADVGGFGLSKYGPDNKYDCTIMRASQENGMNKQEIWSCYASKDKVSDAIKNLFKKV